MSKYSDYVSEGESDHGQLTGLNDDDHSQYHTDARGDTRYYTKAEIDTISGTLVDQIPIDYYTTGAMDNIIATTSGSLQNQIDQIDQDISWNDVSGKPSTFTPTSHGNEAHTSTFITADSLPTDFYSQAEVNSISGTLNSALIEHKTSSDHDDRYFTETEVNTKLTTTSGVLLSQIITDHGALSGRGDDDHTQYLLANGTRTVLGDLIPEMTGASGIVSTRNLGGPTTKFKGLYVGSVYAEGGSIYVNGKKVLEDDNDTIVVSTDTDQALKIKTTGNGVLYLESDNEINADSDGGIELNVSSAYSTKHINVTNNSSGGNITFYANGTNSEVQFSANDEISFDAPTISFNGDVTITGSLIGGEHSHNEYVTSGTDDTVAANTTWQDNNKVQLGTGSDLQIYHDGTNNKIATTNGEIKIFNQGGSEEMIRAIPGGAVILSHNGVSKFATNANGVQIVNAAEAGDGTVSAPSFTFSTDTNTGVYSAGADILGLSAGGVNGLNLSTTQVNVNMNGTAATPSLIINDSNSGMYKPNTDEIGWSTNGVHRMILNNGGIILENDLIVKGNLSVSGTSYTTNTETVEIEDNLLFINKGEVGAGVTKGIAGIAVDRGSLNDYHFYFDETQDNFRIGVSGTTLQAVATREDNPTDLKVPYWNDTEYRYDTVSGTIYQKNGNVGIGTAAPEAKLHVIGEAGASGGGNAPDAIKFVGGTGGENLEPMGMGGDGGNIYVAGGVGGLGDSGMDGSNGIIYLQNDGGNVEIGSSVNSGSLSVRGGTSNVYIGLSGGNLTIAGVNEPAINFYEGGTNAGSIAGGVGSSNMDIRIRPSSLGGNVLFADNGGNVGIGTTSPSNKLDVLAASYLTIRMTESKTDSTMQRTGLVAQHYTAAEEPLGLIMGRTDATTSTVAIGGYVSSSNAATLISFYTAANTTTVGGTERMRITSGGLVGIGTESPTYNFHVVGDGYFTSNLGVGIAPNALKGIYSASSVANTNNQLGVEGQCYPTTNIAGTYYSFGGGFYCRNSVASGITNSGYAMGLDTHGYLDGPGNLNATYGARIDSGTRSGGTGTVGTAYGAQIRVLNGGSGTITTAFGAYITSSVYSGTITNMYGLYIATLGGTNKFGIYQVGSGDKNYFAGNVGIGITAPNAALHLTSASGTTLKIDFAERTYNENDVLSSLEFGSPNGENSSGTQPITAYIRAVHTRAGTGHTNEDGGLTFGTLPSTGSVTERMRIDENGDVGIGTTTPIGMLEVAGSHSSSSPITFRSTSANWFDLWRNDGSTDNNFLRFRSTSNGANNWSVGVLNGTDDFYINEDTASNPRLVIKDGGNVGIGTTSPGQKLSVVGSISVGEGGDGGLYIGQPSYQASLLYNVNGNLDITPRSGYNTIFTAGNVGIGTGSTPGAKLHVKASAAGEVLRLQGYGSYSEIGMYDSDGNADGYIYSETGTIGFLDDDGHWAYKHTTDTSHIFSINNTVYTTIDTNGLTMGAGTSINEFSIDGTLSGNSDDAVPTEKAVKTYVDARSTTLTAVPGTDHTISGPNTTLTAGTALSFGQVCYMGSDGKMELADADAVATAFAWAIAGATISENATGTFGLSGCFVRDDTWNWTSLGQPVYLDTVTAGGMTQTAPTGTDDVIQILGIATTADTIFFNPQLVQIEHT